MPARSAPFLAPPRPWVMPANRLKRYPHFDGEMTVRQATQLACDPQAVARHEFLPLLLFEEKKRYFRKPGAPHKPPKARPLRYAARADAYIYMRYREWLSCLYEDRLAKLGIGGAVLAYRRIPRSGRPGNKSNVDFAFEAVEQVRRMGDCDVICIDIKSFFESLDHRLLQRAWQDLLGVEALPPDHYRVFRSLTKYVEVERSEVLRNLGIWGWRKIAGRRHPVEGYLVPKKDVPVRLCDMATMRRIVFDGPRDARLAKIRREPFGIPQGTPISDLLANVYMTGFDVEVSSLARTLGGVYMRYSDDILLALPAEKNRCYPDIVGRLEEILASHGIELRISHEKTTVHRFRRGENGLTCDPVHPQRLRKGFEYLGFRFDGNTIRIRDSTISRLRQRIDSSTRQAASRAVRASRGRTADQILADYDFRTLYERFGRVRDFGRETPKNGWTFRTYVKRIEDVLGAESRVILRQVGNQQRWIRESFARHIEGLLIKRTAERTGEGQSSGEA